MTQTPLTSRDLVTPGFPESADSLFRLGSGCVIVAPLGGRVGFLRGTADTTMGVTAFHSRRVQVGGFWNPSKRSRWPLGLMGMLAMVAGAERVVARNNRPLGHITPLSWQFSREASGTSARTCEILCLGSSVLKCGLIPRIIEEKTGRKTYNLALMAGRINANYYLLRRLLNSGARPKAILIDVISVSSVSGVEEGQKGDLQRDLRNWPELLSCQDTLDLAWTARDVDLLAAVLARRVLASLRCRQEIGWLVLDLVTLRTSGARQVYRFAMRNWVVNRGAQVMERNLVFESQAAGEATAGLAAPKVFEPNPLTLTYARRFLDLAEAHQIRIFWLIPPLTPQGELACRLKGQEAFIARFARQLLAERPGSVVIDGAHRGYTADAFWDDAHLNGTGARVFSAGVASAVRHHLSGTGSTTNWVVLPAYRTPADDPHLEYMKQSREVVLQGLASRR
jgi:hypothetical protein